MKIYGIRYRGLSYWVLDNVSRLVPALEEMGPLRTPIAQVKKSSIRVYVRHKSKIKKIRSDTPSAVSSLQIISNHYVDKWIPTSFLHLMVLNLYLAIVNFHLVESGKLW